MNIQVLTAMAEEFIGIVKDRGEGRLVKNESVAAFTYYKDGGFGPECPFLVEHDGESMRVGEDKAASLALAFLYTGHV